MSSSHDPAFQERIALAAAARQKAIERLRAKPPVDEAVLAERRATREAKAVAEAEKRAAKIAAKKQAEAEKAEARRAAMPVAAPVLTDAERKAIRDAKYAARKGRK